jgi:hypothetical protein
MMMMMMFPTPTPALNVYSKPTVVEGFVNRRMPPVGNDIHVQGESVEVVLEGCFVLLRKSVTVLIYPSLVTRWVGHLSAYEWRAYKI